MNKKSFWKRGAVLALCPLALASCFNDVDLSNIDMEMALPASLALPAGKARLELKDLLERIDTDSLIAVDGDGGLEVALTDSMTYEMTPIALSEKVDDFDVTYAFSEYISEHGIPGDVDLSLPAGQTISEFVTYDFFDMQMNEDEREMIREAQVSELRFSVQVSHTLADLPVGDLQVKIEFDPDKVRYTDGRTGMVADSITPQPGVPGQFVFRNLDITPFEGGDDRTGGLPLKMTLTIYTGDGLTISTSDKLTTSFSLETLDWTVAYGTFSAVKMEQHIGTITDFDLSFLDGFKLYDPQVNFGVRTNAGIPVLFDIAYVKAYREDEAGNPVAGSEVFASFGGSQSTTLDIDNVAEMPGLWGGENWFRFDRESAQTNALFATDPLPNALEFAYSARADERADGSLSFLTPDAAVHVVREAVVPLWFDESAEGSEIVIRDTIAGLELDSLMPDGIVLEQALLALTLENGLPVGFELALDAFLDADGQAVDVPLDNRYELPMPDVDDEGRVPQDAAAEPVQWNIDVDQAAYDALRRVNSIVYSIHLRQEPGKRVRFETDNYFGMQVGVYVKGEVNSSIMEQ